jgi:catechol 2,3-dioxygenase-like lactoylglutathione lyase family enzyme
VGGRSGAFVGGAVRGAMAALALLASFPPVAGAAEPPVRFGYVAACVADVAHATDFFATTFGWGSQPTGSGRGDAVVRAGDFRLELREAPRHETSDRPHCRAGTYSTLVFHARSPEEIERALARLPQVRVERDPDGAVSLPREASGGTHVRLAVSGDEQGRAEPAAGASARVDRLAIIVRDADRAAAFYTDVLGLERYPETLVLESGGNERSGGMRVAFIDARGVWLALVQPVGPGPLMDYLDRKGDGYVAELIVDVDDLDGFYDRMRARGVQMVDTSGNPVDPQLKAHVLHPYGDRIAYFPTDFSAGLVVELCERGPPETSLLHRRDRRGR